MLSCPADDPALHPSSEKTPSVEKTNTPLKLTRTTKPQLNYPIEKESYFQKINYWVSSQITMKRQVKAFEVKPPQ